MRRAAALLLLVAAPAAARPFPPITSRDFELDLYNGVVLGSIRTVGMGGASVALVEQSSGMAANAAAPAVRPATSNDWFDWSLSLDWMNPDLGEDLDNNGDPDGDEASFGIATVGGAIELGRWGIGLDFSGSERAVDEELFFSSVTTRLLVAYAFPGDAITIGAGFRVGAMELKAGDDDAESLIAVAAISLTAGALWRPRELDLRVGVSGSLPAEAGVGECSACGDRILPERVRLPWELAVGAAWRFGPTPWNQQIPAEFRDERALTVAADVVVIGVGARTYGLQRWGAGELQASGRDVALSVRGGADFEWIPGWLRVRAGSYWEPGRLEGTGGRLHLTGGTAVRLFAFHLWGATHRVRLSLTLDGARDYLNGGFSLGFW